MAVPKIVNSFDNAVADIFDGATVMFGGAQGPLGRPENLIQALVSQGAKDLTIIANDGGMGVKHADIFGYPKKIIDQGVLIDNGQVKKVICGFLAPANRRDVSVVQQMEAGKIEVELVPFGTLALRIWAGGAGVGGVYDPTGVGTIAEEGKEKRVINGKQYILQLPLTADFALIWAYKADKLGNLVYRGTGRQFNPVVARAARTTIVEVEDIVEPGELDPEVIVTPGIFVHRIVKIPRG